MPKLTLTFGPVTQNHKGSSSYHPQLTCEVWKWFGKNCSRYRVYKVKRDGPNHQPTHPLTHPTTHELPRYYMECQSWPWPLQGKAWRTHPLTQPPTNCRVTISLPTLLRGDDNETISIATKVNDLVYDIYNHFHFCIFIALLPIVRDGPMLPFMTNATISIGILQLFRSWISTIQFHRPMVLLFHSLYNMLGLAPLSLSYENFIL